jgi:hypothetical protein
MKHGLITGVIKGQILTNTDSILFTFMPELIINTYVTLFMNLKYGKVLTNKFVGTGPSSYKKII